MLPASSLLLALGASAAASAALVLALRTYFAHDEPTPLAFKTSRATERKSWAAFWARDPFVQAHRNRTAFAFGQYIVPGGEVMATHFSGLDFWKHTLILGATGCGKSSLLDAIARCHLEEERPFALLDLHGDLFQRVAAWALVLKPRGLTLLDFTKPDLLPSWNPLVRMPDVDPGRQVDLLVGILKRLYADETVASWSWGVKAEELLRHALRACIESTKDVNLTDLPAFFLSPPYRDSILATASDTTRSYFTNPQTYGAKEAQYVSAVLNKLEPFLGSAAVQRFFGHAAASVDLLGVLDRGDTLLVNIPRGYLGTAAEVMGRLLVNALQLAALRRERIAPERRLPYSLLLDEAQTLAGADSGLEEFLVAARKYKVFVTLVGPRLVLVSAAHPAAPAWQHRQPVLLSLVLRRGARSRAGCAGTARKRVARTDSPARQHR
ncbi:MAG TPA: ABC transporter ATP-binding protein [Thermoanaerobaculia bacterium]|nr:ABC transporter ATP-binding protein [Thermoanaerobaculia bacterium]